jgi:hypothetical protein
VYITGRGAVVDLQLSSSIRGGRLSGVDVSLIADAGDEDVCETRKELQDASIEEKPGVKTDRETDADEGIEDRDETWT